MGIRILLFMCLFTLCIPLASSSCGKVLFSTWFTVKEFDVDTRNVTVLIDSGLSGVYAMDYDYENRYVYFPKYSSEEIVRFAYPAKNIILQTVVKTGLYPSGIAVDSANDYIYWIEYDLAGLSRCNLDGSNVTVLSTLSSPWAIRLDLINRWMYIVERYSGILKSRFNSTEQQAIVNFTSQRVDCIDIDTEEQRLFWINYDGDMKSAKDDGSDITIIHSTHSEKAYHAIGVIRTYMYYANYNQLLMVDKAPGSTSNVLYTDTGHIDSIFVFIKSVQPTSPQISQQLQSISNNILVQSIPPECRTAAIRITGLFNHFDIKQIAFVKCKNNMQDMKIDFIHIR
ncbi:low-density lipoprotein receptor-related protein 8-like isoform X2 [Mytilus californianus]|uniref:low-density lipoprotein receptor-related protein 8-like isoform X1 n=2 Tax=Mytilus californianus TaxID=6549 RepID=UPI0022475C91|nr:low-density lipoprotein receptor-related protein 8-like isoform X1 [Mytilus californianus]XP_052065104.1 low-density lipoprotein receptor-related protein 8-like isoform X2 [Mytilus californianus]